MAAAGLLGGASVPIAATAQTTTAPLPPTEPSGSPETPREPTLDMPATAEGGTRITIHGDYWRCDEAGVFPDWSDSVTANVVDGWFEAFVDVPDSAELGPHSIPVACRTTSDRIVRKASIEIVPARVVPTTTVEPTTTKTPVTQPPVTRPPTASPGRGDQRDNRIGDVLGVGSFLLAVGVATLARPRRRKRPADPPRAARHNPRPRMSECT